MSIVIVFCMKKIIGVIARPVILWLLDWSSSMLITYFDLDGDKKVSKKEIKAKLGPNANTLIKILK